MVNLILFILATIGITNILIYGAIFDAPRAWLMKRMPDKIKELMSCYQCMGTWVGFLTGYILLTHDVFGVLMCGGAGSFASHFAAIVVEYLEANSMITLPTPEVDDDSRRLQRLAEGDGFLDHVYPYQYVQNETLSGYSETEIVNFLPIQHTPILKNTMTGTIYHGAQVVQTFVDLDGKFTFTELGATEIWAVGGTLNHNTGDLVLEFNKPVGGEITVVTNYEYNVECQLP